MMSFDLHNSIVTRRAISPVSVSDDTAQVSQIIDTQGYQALEFIIAAGSIADADVTFTVLVEESDNSNMSSQTAIPDAALLGTEALAGFQFDDDNEVRRIGVRVNTCKRYIRMTITPANNASAALLSAVAVLAGGVTPTVNP